jgi:putative spermidine/putrescine transport system permease protein
VITLPFVIRITMAALSTLETGVEEAALNLGAGPWQTFRRVTLPLAFPGLVAGAVISFILSFDELVLTLFLAGPRFNTLPVVMFHYVEAKTDPLVAALSTLLVMLSLVAVVVAERAVGLSAVYGSRK